MRASSWVGFPRIRVLGIAERAGVIRCHCRAWRARLSARRGRLVANCKCIGCYAQCAGSLRHAFERRALR
jgi:hypothetical protein